MSYKPAGHTSVAPYLVLSGAQGTLDFLTQVFDAQVLSVHPGQGDGIGHAEVRIDDTVLMLADGVEGWPAMPCHVHVYVPDVDDTYRRALAAGATSVQAPVQKQDEDRRGAFRDAGGTTWWVGTRVGVR